MVLKSTVFSEWACNSRPGSIACDSCASLCRATPSPTPNISHRRPSLAPRSARSMSLCTHCRLVLRQAARHPHARPRAAAAAAALSTNASPDDLLSRPTWSVRSLRGPPTPSPEQQRHHAITPPQLHHLLRLAALPQPASAGEEAAMIATLQSQLQFVRAVQRVDTAGVEPLSAIRDETDAAVREGTVGLEDLRDALGREARVGHYKRPRRVREKVDAPAEEWDALSTASRKAGKYFVVESGSKENGAP